MLTRPHNTAQQPQQDAGAAGGSGALVRVPIHLLVKERDLGIYRDSGILPMAAVLDLARALDRELAARQSPQQRTGL